VNWLSQVRHLIENSFIPLACECVIGADASLTVRIFDRESGRVDLMVSGVAVNTLKTRQDVADLVSELRDELIAVTAPRPAIEPSSQA
jgi:hypothetical protein